MHNSDINLYINYCSTCSAYSLNKKNNRYYDLEQIIIILPWGNFLNFLLKKYMKNNFQSIFLINDNNGIKSFYTEKLI